MESDEPVRTLTLRAAADKRVTFGRQDSNVVQLRSMLVSREHGWFERVGGQWYVCEREGVANPLRVNGQPLTRIAYNGQAVLAARLSAGDALRIDSPSGVHAEGLQAVFLSAADRVAGNSVPLGGKQRFTIGRDPSCDIVIPHVSVSRQHAALVRQGYSFVLEDNHSTNGTSLNNHPVTGAAHVARHDVIGIANTHIFVSPSEAFVITQENGFALEASGLTKSVLVKSDGSLKLKRKTILENAAVSIAPGEFVAIIGGSGTGKSTLLGAISGFANADKGSVLVRGQDLYSGFSVLKSSIGFVPQKDIVFEQLTLERMLLYAAKMRMPSDTTDTERHTRVREVLDTLELTEHRNSRIGRLSGGQRKRASIAVELLADPSLFFLDEPTSGLDPGTERSLMETMRGISRRGKTVVLVTHTTLNLSLCDKVIVMGAGGRVCSCMTPDDTKRLYHVDDYVDIYDIVKARGEIYANEYSTRNQSIAQTHTKPPVKRKTGLSLASQYSLQVQRSTELTVKSVTRMIALLVQAPILGAVISVVADNDVFSMFPNTQSILFTLSVAAIWMGMLGAVTEICKERTILRRELLAGMSRLAYLLSKLTVAIVCYLIQTILLLFTFCLLAKPPDAALVNWGHAPLSSPIFGMGLTLFITMLTSGCMGFAISALVPSPDTANVFVPYLVLPQLVFAGVIFEMKDGIMKLLKQPVIAHWSMNAMAAAVNANAMDMPYLPGGKILRMNHPVPEEYTHSLANFGHSLSVLGLIALVSLVVCMIGIRRIEKHAD
ncbi:hypothetical protein FACS1894184_05130 [Clostridia bacterium]|nr:hypothetical protein FACS1894184_05130 [Clostridia bacterium]